MDIWCKLCWPRIINKIRLVCCKFYLKGNKNKCIHYENSIKPIGMHTIIYIC